MLQILLHVVPIIQGGPEFELVTNSGNRKVFEPKLADYNLLTRNRRTDNHLNRTRTEPGLNGLELGSTTPTIS